MADLMFTLKASIQKCGRKTPLALVFHKAHMAMPNCRRSREGNSFKEEPRRSN